MLVMLSFASCSSKQCFPGVDVILLVGVFLFSVTSPPLPMNMPTKTGEGIPGRRIPSDPIGETSRRQRARAFCDEPGRPLPSAAVLPGAPVGRGRVDDGRRPGLYVHSCTDEQ